jgi:tetratricopeptide (TPR) repeat protein
VDAAPAVQADLRKYFGTTDVTALLLRYLVLDNDALRRFAERGEGGEVNTDVNMRLEFDAPLRLFLPADQLEDAGHALLAAADPVSFARVLAPQEWTADRLDALKRLVGVYAHHRQSAAARPLVDFALRVSPENPFFLAERLLLERSGDDRAFREGVARLIRLSKEEANRLGAILWKANDYARAVVVFQELVRAVPGSAVTWTNLAVNYQALGQRDEADQAFRKARALDPLNEFVVMAYEEFSKGRGPERPQ